MSPGLTDMLTLAASDSSAAAPRCGHADPELGRTLVAVSEDSQQLPWQYGSLLAGTVYVTDYELVLGDRGPYLELSPVGRGPSRALVVYTSRARISDALDAAEAEAMPFAAVLQGLPPGVAVLLDPEGPGGHRIGSTELERLRRVLAED